MIVMIHWLQLEDLCQECFWQMIRPSQEGRLQEA